MGSNPTSPRRPAISSLPRLNQTVLTSIALTGFTVAFFHAAIPTHWLPFVATGRAQRWSHRKTLAITALAGTGHVLATALLGLLLTLFGVAVSARIGIWFPRVAGALLVGLGIFFLVRQMAGRRSGHVHLFAHSAHEHEHEHEHQHGHATSRASDQVASADDSRFTNHDSRVIEHAHGSVARRSDRVAIMSLFALLTFSPCEGFLPIYVSGIRFGWSGFVLLTCILSVATVTGMLCFTGLTLAGVRKVRLRWFEQHEAGLMGSLLVVVGVLVLLFER